MRQTHTTRPSVDGLRKITVAVDPEIYEVFKGIGVSIGVSQDYLGHKALALLFKWCGRDLPDALETRLERSTRRRPGPRRKAGKRPTNTMGDGGA